MALICALRGIPRSLHGSRSVLRALSRGELASQTTSISSRLQLQRPVLCLTGVKAFSVSPRQQMSAEHGHDHTKLWTAERALSLGLLGLIPMAFITPCPALDYTLALALVMHSHWGLEAVVVDYMRPAVVGAALSKLSMGALYFVSAMTLGGLCYFTYTDVGLANAVKMLWKL